jgi:hypothetical protein
MTRLQSKSEARRRPLSRVTHWRPLLLCAALASGCGAGEGAPSYDLALITEDAVRATPLWRFDERPEVEITRAGAEPFVNVARGVRVGDRIVIADPGAARLTFHALDGALIRASGRRGEGPGEFQHPAWLGGFGADSVLVWDAGHRRFSVYSLDGEWGRSFSPEGVTGAFPAVLGVFADRTILMTAGMALAGAGGSPWRDTLSFLRLGPEGDVLGTVGRFPGPENYEVPAAGGRVYARPFGRETVVAVQADRFSVATGDAYEVVSLDVEGSARGGFRRDAPPVPITRGDVAAYRADLLEAVGPSEAPAWRRALDAATFPDHVPPVSGLVPAPGGAVWVREAQPPYTYAEGARWAVYAPDGTPTARIALPPRFTLWQVGDGWALGGVTDEDGTERVWLYRLRGG